MIHNAARIRRRVGALSRRGGIFVREGLLRGTTLAAKEDASREGA